MMKVSITRDLIVFVAVCNLVISCAHASDTKDCVVLLHGLARTSKSMTVLENRLQAEGFEAVNINYPSTKYSVAELSRMVVPQGIQECERKKTLQKASKIHFVTHSLGGILVRLYFASHKHPKLGRVVMLGPPNQGSEVVDALKDVPGFELINGPAGQELGTGDSDIPKSLGPVDFELGVIAGTQSINLFLSILLPNTDDGKVTVESAKVAGMKDFITIATSHPFMMKKDKVIEQVLHFLKYGKFLR